VQKLDLKNGLFDILPARKLQKNKKIISRREKKK